MVDNSHNNGKISRRAIFLFPTDNLVYSDHCLLTVREQLEDSKKATFHMLRAARTPFFKDIFCRYKRSKGHVGHSVQHISRLFLTA